MSDEIKEGFITLIDEDENEMEFEILEEIENEKGKFYALVPNFELSDMEDGGEDTYFIFKATNPDSGDEQLEEVEDEELLDELSEIFENKFSEQFQLED